MRATMRLSWIPWVAALGACATSKPEPAPSVAPPKANVAAAEPPARDALDRATFNRMAQRLDLPLFWAQDADGDRSVDPDEVVTLRFFSTAPVWKRGGRFTDEFDTALRAMIAASSATQGADEEGRRRAAVIADLDQVRPALVQSDLRGATDTEKRALGLLLEAGAIIDRIYATQTGAAALAGNLPDDAASRSLFRRNWGPKCAAPKTEKDPACSAIPGAPGVVVDAYPGDVQAEAGFCAALEKRPDAKALLSPFVVVRHQGQNLVAVPYAEAYREPMAEVAKRLEQAAELLGVDEQALAAYLRAAAGAFRDNNWEAADEAWAAMNGRNSKYYLRVGPDETYADPCSQKAGFHMTLARINPASLAWQDKLSPLLQEMERSLASLVGAPYRERKVTFHLPDFIDIIANSGDDRPPLGATIGQSLPNWGKVAEESRGRTVVMTNLFRDPDSLADSHNLVSSLLDTQAAAMHTSDATPGLLSTILHEATHNLGPSHEYAYRGKTDALAFGGALAATMEELKAETGSLYLLDLLAARGVIDGELRRRTYADVVRWSFGHIARGMRTASGKPKPYSQLAAIQLGFLIDQGALAWDAGAKAANGTDTGAFHLRFDRFPRACELLMQTVGRIKAKNDRAAAEALVKKYVDGDLVPQAIITERVLRQPRTAPVYTIDL